MLGNNMVDIVLLEIIKSYLSNTAAEMAKSFDRTAYQAIITEVRDYGIGLFDKDFNMIAESVGLPPFSGTLAPGISSSVEEIGVENLVEGDVGWNSWPYTNGSQVNDATIFSPIFHGSQLIGYSAAKAHQMDIGQKDPAYCIDTTDVYQEGLKMSGVRIVKGGKLDEEIVRIIRNNTRIPDRTMGDVHAQISCVQYGVKRVKSLVEKYGVDVFNQSTSKIIEYGEKLARSKLEKLPKGTWSAEDYLDTDVVTGEPVNMKVTITINDNEFFVDYSGSDPQNSGTVNTPFAWSASAANCVFKSFTTYDEPSNQGHFKPVRVFAPEGSVFNPQPPAGVFLVWAGLHAFDLIRKALIQSMPDKLPACSGGDVFGMMFQGGFDKKTQYKEHYMHLNDHGVGLGAYKGSDGANAIVHDSIAGALNTPTEVNETQCPTLVKRWELVTDSGGAGQWRGGLAMLEEVVILNPSKIAAISLRTHSPPWGFNSGKNGKPGMARVYDKDKSLKMTISAGSHYVDADYSAICVSGGGGGWGDPLDREIKSIERDLEYEYISEKEAKEQYGIIINSNTGKIDYKLTEENRKNIRLNNPK